MKLILKILARICFSFILALVCLGFILEQDSWLKHRIKIAISSSLSDIVKAPFSFELKNISFLTGELIFENIKVKDPQGKWSFESPLMALQISWLSFLKQSQFSTEFIFYEPVMHSLIEQNNPVIYEPIFRIIDAPSTLPLKFKQCSAHNGILKLEDKDKNIDVVVNVTGSITNKPTTLIATLYCNDGEIIYKSNTLAQNLQGSLVIDVPDNRAQTCARINIIADIPKLNIPERQLIISGSYKDGMGLCKIKHPQELFNIQAQNVVYNNQGMTCDLKAEGFVNTFAQIIGKNFSGKLGGKGDAQVRIHAKDGVCNFEGACDFTSLSYDSIKFSKCSIKGKGDTKHGGHGNIQIDTTDKALSVGIWNYNIPLQTIHTELNLAQPLALPLSFTVSDAHIDCLANLHNTTLSMRYSCDFKQKNYKKFSINGAAQLTKDSITMQGRAFDYSYNALLAISGDIKEMALQSKQKKVLEVKRKGNTMQGMIEYELLKKLAKDFFDVSLSGEGSISLKSDCKKNTYNTAFQLNNSNIRIPHIYNIIKDIQGHISYDPTKQTITFDNIIILLHKGRIQSLNAIIKFNEHSSIDFINIPLTFYNCFISWKKDFFGMLSGALTTTYAHEKGYCKGHLALEKSTLRSNLLSAQVQRDFAGGTLRTLPNFIKDMNFHVLLQSKAPLKVKTPFLEVSAFIHGLLKGTLINPELTGSIDLTQGSLAFPYKPLYITSGKIYVLPHQIEDPLIELHAKNKFKKHTITLDVSGSLQQPKITLNASPHLQEEQILTLLLSGSEEGNLYLVMPNLIMQNIESLLFGPIENSSMVQRYLKSMLKPLKGVRITPTLSDQTAEGKGVHGAVEIDINDRLRAKVQNNLNLSEDTQVEVEYSVSDDISLKATKDDKGTLAGEVEMRWKF